jgi:hypothetical protein
MIETFPREVENDGHAEFQQWRREHPHGFVLNHKTETLAMLHRSACAHFGDMEHTRGEWADLAKRLKLCSDDRAALVDRANGSGIKLQTCADCKP